MDKKIIVWPGVVDHIVVEDVEYTRTNKRTQVQTKITAKMFKVNIKKANMFAIGRPAVKALFEGRDDELMDMYKEIDTEERNGEQIISAKAIKDYINKKEEWDEEEKKRMENTLLKWDSGDACKKDRETGTMGFIFGTLPISDGVEEWMQFYDNKPALKSNGERIIQTHLSVCALVTWRDDEGWVPMNGGDSLYNALEIEVTDQKTNWRPVKKRTAEAEETQENEDSEDDDSEDASVD